METVIEIRGLDLPGWFEELTSRLDAEGDIAPASLSALRAPPGAVGASAAERFRAHLQTAAQLASVVCASIALYHLGDGAATNSCEVSVTDGASSVTVVLPGKSSQSLDPTQVLEGILAKLKGTPNSIIITPAKDDHG